MRAWNAVVLGLMLLVVVSLWAPDRVGAAKIDRPNFVVIFIDDMGYGDIGPFGSDRNDTPHLDRMAEEGLKLTSFYVAAAVCTPSRAGLMTGTYPRRINLAEGWRHSVLFPGDPKGLNPEEVTIAEVLRDAGYATGCFGKWHLGDQPKFLPTNQGFDTYFGIPYSNDMWPGHKRWPFPPLPVLRGTEVVDRITDMQGQARLCKRFTDAAVRFIKDHQDEPFFVYLPHSFVHLPRRARPRFMNQAKSAAQAVLEEVDWSVGRILQTLREAGLAEETLVLFTSDNGPAGGLSSGPLRGNKGTVWEGGFREPTIAWWPETIPASSVCDEMATTMDLLPTFAALAGGEAPNDRVIDGHNIRSLLLGPDDAQSPYKHFFYYRRNKLRAVRSGPWKLFRNGRLYNLEKDLGERHNVAKQHPKVIKRLRRSMKRFQKNIEQHNRPAGHVENARTLLPRPGVAGEKAYAPTLKGEK
jgi:arylsulfatase A-like enzyme